MKNYSTTFRLMLVCLFLCSEIRAQDRFRRIRRKIGEDRFCNFDEARSNYDATDLLRCIDELAVDLIDRESGVLKVSNGKGQLNGFTGRKISFMDVFSSVFNNLFYLQSHQSSSLPVYPISDYQQSNYPSETVGLSPGFQLNLLDTLSTISSHDDYKCVPRILCEVASGKLPGRSLGKQSSGFFELLGRNVFTDWLTKIDVAGMSPLLNFGRAMILGYSNRGNSVACYEAFPKCPRDTNGLIYYLNNYNGGFFNLFNRIRGGKYRTSNGDPGQPVNDYSKIEVRERIVAGSSTEPIRNEPVLNTVQFPSIEYQKYYANGEYPRFDTIRNYNAITFPDQRELSIEPTNSLQDDVPKSEPYVWQRDNVAFFPKENQDRRISRFRFPSRFTIAPS
ncbi:uncharacterized protein LOC126868398 [Bombus huntii]|uniref:uncharacterized protein LOC126868398 n=1 Tax=Bombus huntii TaxID=85661 RepID=UPI0021AA3E5A|nr:uncharacterized protein LOC126868398 [Bombus huntii]